MTSEIQQAVLTHLSKEIELVSQALLEQRTHNNLIVAFSPYLILGGVAASQHAKAWLSRPSTGMWRLIMLVILAGYALLGFIAASIERKLWLHANLLRAEYSRMAGIPDRLLDFPPGGLEGIYVGIFGALGLVFIALLHLMVSASQREK